MRDPKSCPHCPEVPVFETGYERDRHLVSSHNYDTCKVCHLIGPSMSVMVHIATEHHHHLCYLCGSQSPVFAKEVKVKFHLRTSHQLPPDSDFCCPNCDNLSLPDLPTFTKHFKQEHNWDPSSLRPIKRKRNPVNSQENATENILNPISGLRNERHRDCHLFTVLHLLGQTTLPDILKTVDQHEDCLSHPRCLLSGFFAEYEKSLSFFPYKIVENPASFVGDKSFPLTVIDLIRSLLHNTSTIPTEGGTMNNGEILEDYKSILEWKFDCPKCNRFVNTRLKDFVLTIKAVDVASFESHLNTFLTQKPCSCGFICDTSPNVRHAGDFIFVEIDRKKGVSLNDEFQVSLYPLKLHKNYEIFGESYEVFATVNYNLDYAEGGHYVLNLPIGNDEVMKIHEDSIEKLIIPAVFDSDAVIVALRKMKDNNSNSVNDLLLTSDAEINTIENDCIQQEPYDPSDRKTGRLVPNTLMHTSDVRINDFSTASSTVSPHKATELSKHETDPGKILPRAITYSVNSACGEDCNSEAIACWSDTDFTDDDQTSERNKKELSVPKQSIMLHGDNLRLYLNDDKRVVEKYRQAYLKKVEDEVNQEIESIKDVSLKSLGDQVLQSKIYKIQSLSGSKKRRKKFHNIDSNIIDVNEIPNTVENILSLPLTIPEEVGELTIGC